MEDSLEHLEVGIWRFGLSAICGIGFGRENISDIKDDNHTPDRTQEIWSFRAF